MSKIDEKAKEKAFSMRMDMKDMLNYRTILEKKRDESLRIHGVDDDKYRKLQKQCDMMDQVFDVAWIATMTDILPEFKALTGGDFDVVSLKLALPEFAEAVIQDDTQVKIEFVEEKVEEQSKAIRTFMDEVKELMSRSITKSIPKAVDIYLKNTGKKLSLAEAYIEIKNLLPEVGTIPAWDTYIATQYRMLGSIAAFKAVKRWLDDWDDIDLGIIAEDAVRRTAKNPRTLPKDALLLEELLLKELTREDFAALKKDATNIEILKSTCCKDQPLALIEQRIGYIACAFNPKKRLDLEVNSGRRKPYVEKGYPE